MTTWPQVPAPYSSFSNLLPEALQSPDDYEAFENHALKGIDFGRPVYIPVHQTTPFLHWLLVAIDFESNKMKIFDSLKSLSIRSYNKVTSLLMGWLERVRPGCSLSMQMVLERNTPQQPSKDNTCGVFVCQFMKAIVLGLDPCSIVCAKATDRARLATHYRGKMYQEIASGGIDMLQSSLSY